MKMIYLACPYSHLDERIREKRYQFVTKVAGWLMTTGYVVFSPITHSHSIERFWERGVKGWEFWQNQDLEMIRRSDEVVVLAIRGWTESVGVTDEIVYAAKIRKPFRILDPSDLPDDLQQTAKDWRL